MRLAYIHYGTLILHTIFIALIGGWVLISDYSNPWPILALQTGPLLLLMPLLISARPPLLHLALTVILFYLCFSAPNLFASGLTSWYAIVEVVVNVILSSVIMWHLMRLSKASRLARAEA